MRKAESNEDSRLLPQLAHRFAHGGAAWDWRCRSVRRAGGLAVAGRDELCFLGTASPILKDLLCGQQSAGADDNGPGTRARPFRTVSKAAQVLHPGERVVIASGTYRECVRPCAGGTGPAQMISYEAARGAKVFIKGSEILKDGWQQESVSMRRFGPAGQSASQITSWQHDLTGTMFPDAYNPFALDSAPGDRAWLDTKAVDMGPYFRRRGLVFVDGMPLEPMEQLRELATRRLNPRPRRRSRH